MSEHSTLPPTDSMSVRCAACARSLGSVTNQGWTWTKGPARIVNRRRFICTKAVHEAAPSAPVDDFRMRSVQRARNEDPEYTVWEYPYVCDSDACMNALGDDWQAPDRRDTGPAYCLMPAGQLLS